MGFIWGWASRGVQKIQKLSETQRNESWQDWARDAIGEWWWSDWTDGGMWEILDGEDFDHPHPWLIPVTLSHLKMSLLSFHGHSNTEWPQSEWDDAGMTIFPYSNDGEWLEWGLNDEIFESRQMP